MKFHLSNNTLTIQPECVAEAGVVLGQYRWLDNKRTELPYVNLTEERIREHISMLESILSGEFVATAAATENRPWFEVDATLPQEAIAPYLSLLYQLTGFQGRIEEIPFPPKDCGLCATHVTTSCLVSSDGIRSSGYIRSGNSAADTAKSGFYDYVVEVFGYRPREPEYIQSGNGTMIPNREYGKHRQAGFGLGSVSLWKFLFIWWRDNHATAGQLSALKESDANSPYGESWMVRDSGKAEVHLIGTAGLAMPDCKNLSWDSFKQL